MFSWRGSKLLSVNQISEFLKQRHLKNEGVNQPHIESIMLLGIQGDLKYFVKVGS